MIDVDYLERVIRDCEIIEIPTAQVLYRGTFEGEPGEYPNMNIITGVKTFAFDQQEALKYADPNPLTNLACKRPRSSDARSVLFTASLVARCHAFVWQNLGRHFQAAGITDYRPFEQQQLFPIARRALGNSLVAGYVTNKDLSQAYEAVIDTSRVGLCHVSTRYVEFGNPPVGNFPLGLGLHSGRFRPTMNA